MENADEPESGKTPAKRPPSRSGSRSASPRSAGSRKPATGSTAGATGKPAAKGKASSPRTSGTAARGGRPASSTASSGAAASGAADSAERPESAPATTPPAGSAEPGESVAAERAPFVAPKLTVPTISGGATARPRDVEPHNDDAASANDDVAADGATEDSAEPEVAVESKDAEGDAEPEETGSGAGEEEVATDADGDAAVETSTETETETDAETETEADAETETEADAETETEADADLASSAIAPPEYEPVPGADLVPAPLPSQSGAMLSVRGLTKRFDDTAAVRGIDLDVPVGSIFGIVGPNGAGKTTTLSMITGLLRPDAGTITVHGADVWADPVAAKRQLGVLPDRLRLFDRLTGSQLLYYSAVLRGLDGAVAKRRVADLAAVFRIEDALGRLVSDYSTGMTKKVALAAAMIHAPRMLVLDEPFESVDPVSAATVTGILRDYVAAGGTVLLSSHSMALVERICDRVAVIVDGDVLAVGSIDEVRGDVSLEERFVQLAGSTAELEGVEWLHTFSD